MDVKDWRGIKVSYVVFNSLTHANHPTPLCFPVLCMEVQCKAPGCVPVETNIVIVFPSSSGSSGWNTGGVVDVGLVEEGKYTTKVLKPMLEVEQGDVVGALPPELGGTYSVSGEFERIRDFVKGQLEQVGCTKEERGMGVEFLIAAMKEYKEGLEWVEGGEKIMPVADGEDVENSVNSGKPKPMAFEGSGNFVIKRSINTITQSAPSGIQSPPPPPPTVPRAKLFSERDRESQRLMMEGGTSNSLMGAMKEREKHAPGVRRRGCPCCDPDDPENVLDMMMGI